MKFLLFASIFSFAVAAAVGSVDNRDVGIADQVDDNNLAIRDDKKIYNSNINYRAYKGTLSKDDCNDIAKAFISVLQNKNYKGQPPSKTYKKYLAKNFVERSGSINSLISKNNDVNLLPILSQSNSNPHYFTQQNTNKSPRSAPPSSTPATSGTKA
jgi:hypothetical protein